MSSIYLAFVKLANCWKPLTIIKNYFMLDVLLGTNSYNYDFFFHELIMWKDAIVMAILIYFRDYWHRNRPIDFIRQPF